MHPLTTLKGLSLKQVLKLVNYKYLNFLKKLRCSSLYMALEGLSKVPPTSKFRTVSGHLLVFVIPLINHFSIKAI